MQGEDGVIVAVHARRSCLLRKAPSKNRAQILAANIDQALLVFAAREPEPKPGLLDRFLVACNLAGIEAVITINKIDQGLEEVERWLPAYRSLDKRVLLVSARTGWGLGAVKRMLVDRTTLFCGPSGAGKSSLLNAVYPGFRLKVGELSESTGKGRHTTTAAELMPLPYGGFVVDTPGLKEFGVWEATREEIEEAFPEIASRKSNCRYPDCSHVQEPDCAVLAAVGSEPIVPRIPGVKSKNVFYAPDVYGNDTVLGNKIVIIGGGEVGVELGIYLAQNGHQVTVLEMLSKLAYNAVPLHFYSMFRETWEKERNFRSILQARCTRIETDKVTYVDANAIEHVVTVDSVVIAVGMKPRNDLAMKFHNAGGRLYMIGDCNVVGNVQKAMRSGFSTASTL